MVLTNAQILAAYAKLANEISLTIAQRFTKPELKQAIIDAEAWAETPAVKQDFNNNLTAGNFKTNATADEKRLALIFALLAIINGS